MVFFGFYESLNDPETARALCDAVAAWGAAKGMEILRGPMSLNMNDECAFLVEGFDSPPAIMMPYNPKYYLDLMEACGMAKAKDLFAFRMSRDHAVAAKVAAVVERSPEGVPVHPPPRRHEAPGARGPEAVALVYNSGWEKNWGFVPWTDERDEAHGRNS